MIDVAGFTLLLFGTLAILFLLRQTRRQSTLSKRAIWGLAIAGTLASILAGLLWFVVSLIIAISNTPHWPNSGQGAPIWVNPLFEQAAPGGIIISLTSFFFLWRFLRRRMPHSTFED